MSIKIFLLTITILIAIGTGYFILVYHQQDLRINCMQIAKYERHREGGLAPDGSDIDASTYQRCLKELNLASNEK